MLDAEDNDCVDMVFPFVVAMVGSFCGRFDASLTKYFAKYVEVCQILFYGKEPTWPDVKVNVSGDQVRYFQCQWIYIFQSYQTSNIRTSEWHSLDYFGEGLENVGNIYFVHAGMYDSSD